MDTPEPPQDTQIHKIAISDDYKDNALNLIKKMVKGNKYDPEEVVLEEFEGDVLQFQAENRITIIRKDNHQTKPGRVTGPMQVQNEAAAREEMSKAYASLHDDKGLQRQILKTVLKRDDQGFGLDKTVISIKIWKKEFVGYEPCKTCKSDGNIMCMPCSGKGVEVCNRCNGIGKVPCTQCGGAQTVQMPDGTRKQCPKCYGQGKTPCSFCSQTGKVTCTNCRKRGTVRCPNCNGHGWNSHIYVIEIEGRTAFDYPKDRLPDKVVAMIEKYGAGLGEHADIKISEESESAVNLDDEEKQKRVTESERRGDLVISVLYDVFLPQAHMDYNINGKTYYTFLFGTKNVLEYASPFLDDLLKDGLRKLKDAAEKRGDTADNLKQAAQFRTLREAIYYAGTYSAKKAVMAMKKRYSFGLSDRAIKETVINTQHAFKNITHKPRQIGMALGAIINLALLAGYFLTPVRDMVVSNITKTPLHLVTDCVIAAGSFYLGLIVIQVLSQRAIKTVMEKLKIKEPSSPKLGTTLYVYAGISLALFAAIVETARQLGTAPAWYAALF